MTKKSVSVRTPRTARTEDELVAMKRDNVQTDDFWMLTDLYEITLANQKSGEAPTQKISVPRHVFDAFVDWYMTGKWTKPTRRRKVA